ncbi:MAG: Na+/H+ antiporter subunit E [Fimbriimonas sp.]
MLWNLFLMLAWAAMTNDFSAANLALGFAFGYLTLAALAARGVAGEGKYARRTVKAVAFAGFYLRELLMSNLRMARDVLGPWQRLRPAIVAVPLDIETDSDAEITLLANLISLTPGTLSVDLSPDRRTLYVHAMDIPASDLERFRKGLKDELERRVIEVLR